MRLYWFVNICEIFWSIPMKCDSAGQSTAIPSLPVNIISCFLFKILLIWIFECFWEIKFDYNLSNPTNTYLRNKIIKNIFLKIFESFFVVLFNIVWYLNRFYIWIIHTDSYAFIRSDTVKSSIKHRSTAFLKPLRELLNAPAYKLTTMTTGDNCYCKLL